VEEETAFFHLDLHARVRGGIMYLLMASATTLQDFKGKKRHSSTWIY
jgi:hypothetical protein